MISAISFYEILYERFTFLFSKYMSYSSQTNVESNTNTKCCSYFISIIFFLYSAEWKNKSLKRLNVT